MFHVLYEFYKNSAFHLFFISSLVFIFLNVIENYIHYNIGRNRNSKFIELSSPSKKDWIKITVIMLIFAVLQGAFTYLFNKYV